MIMIALIAVDPFIALISLSTFGSMYLLIIYVFTVSSLKIVDAAQESIQVVKSLQEGLGGIRDVLIDNSQDVYFVYIENLILL